MTSPPNSQSTIEENADRFAKLFQGYRGAYGVFKITGEKDTGKKEGNAKTIQGIPSNQLFMKHLKGQCGIGIVPLDENNNVHFAAIDIDVIGIDLDALSKDCRAKEFPLVICRSKSGGAHAYLFLKDPQPATKVVSYLEYCSESLGYGGVEIFPKQTIRSAGSVGNWINLPYYDAAQSERYAFNGGHKLPFLGFCVLAEYIALDDQSFIEACSKVAVETPKRVEHTNTGQERDNIQSRSAGRNDYLFRIACKMSNSGMSDEMVDDLLDTLNENATEDDHPGFAQGSLSKKELKLVKKQFRKYEGNSEKHVSDSVVLQPDDALSIMNQDKAICMDGGNVYVFREAFDPALERDVIYRSSFTDIKNYFKSNKLLVSKTAQGIPKYKFIGEWWLENPEARRYNGVCFHPGKDVEGFYNLWKDFQIKPHKGDCSLFYDHLLNNICDGNEEYYQYLLKWLAFVFQSPGEPGQIAVILRGGKGTGKSILGSIISHMIGQHALHISQAKHLTGNFNAHLQDCVFLFCDEALWAGDKQGESVLKTLITENVIAIEPKGRDLYLVRNCTHIIMASNNDWVVPASFDERRFFVLDVANHKQENRTYFSSLIGQMNNGGYEALMHDFLTMDLSSFDVRAAPKTRALLEQQLLSLNPIEDWWFNKLSRGLLLENHIDWEETVETSSLHSDYVNSLNFSGVSRRGTETKLGRFLKKYVPNIQNVQISTENAMNRVYVLPSLEKCREGFEKVMGQKIEWDEDMEVVSELSQLK